MTTRRDLLIVLIALTALPAYSQQPGKVWRVGRLNHIRRPDSPDSHFTGAFPRGLRELGYVEGKNLIIEDRYSDGELQRLQAQAAELVRLKVDVIATGSSPGTRAARDATGTIPIVMCAEADPVGNGFVASLARPGGNITGLSTLGVDTSAKHLEMLRSMVPTLARVAVLANPDEGVLQTSILKNIQAAAKEIGVTVMSFDARVPGELENAFAQMVRWRAGALILPGGPFINNQPRLIAELAAKHRLPTMSRISEHVVAGNLISYGASLADMFRRGATYVDKIFKGAKPGDLPVEQPTKFELFINRRTAKALGLTIPQSLLISVDKVIE